MEIEVVFYVAVAMLATSAALAAMIAMVADAKQRPAAKHLVDGLMRIALLAAGTILALLSKS